MSEKTLPEADIEEIVDDSSSVEVKPSHEEPNPEAPIIKESSQKSTVDMQANFARIKEIASRFSEDELAAKESTVREIVENVRKRGDEALKEYTKKFDGEDISDFKIPIKPYSANSDENSSYLSKLSLELRQALVDAKYRIRVFHKRDKQHNWSYEGNMKEKLGAIYTPIESVGIYVPGGEAPLVSTVLMTAIPAKVAGVKRVVMVSPPPIDDAVLAAAELAGVDEVYSVGGAQAVAALAYGTDTIAPVDKIVGPGNIFVSLAKKQVFGKVGIDGIYGPSELAILADKTAEPKHLAADLISQLEHGSGLESVLLVTDSQKIADATKEEFATQLAAHMTQTEIGGNVKSTEQIEVIKNSFKKWSDILVVDNLEQGTLLINEYAPEHFELQIHKKKVDFILPLIKNAGAIFIGSSSCESLGDYMAGPSHCLPTGGTTRFSSGLQCSDFVKKSSIVDFSNVDTSSSDFKNLAKEVAVIARAEKLEGHARAMELRLN